MSTSQDQVSLEWDYYGEGRTIPLNEVAETLKFFHTTRCTHDHGRYTLAASIWELVLRDMYSRPSTMHELCVEELPLVLLEIMKDPKIYAWTIGSTSPDYSDELEVCPLSYMCSTEIITEYSYQGYTMNIYRILTACYDYMIESEDFDQYYRGLALKLLQTTPAIWRIVWSNRSILCNRRGKVAFSSEAIICVIDRVIRCTRDLFG